MSYLHPVRLHFAGRFQANVSTVNNDPGPLRQRRRSSRATSRCRRPTAMNGWFNPEGDGAWRLMGCRVTSAWSAASIDQPLTTDPVLGLLVADADDATSAKLVDLDPEQQMVSTIFGMQIRLADPDGDVGAARRVRAGGVHGHLGPGHHQPRAATPSPVRCTSRCCTDLQWGDVGASPFLVELQQRRAGRTAVDQVQHRRHQHELHVAGLHERADRRHDRPGDEGRAAALRRRPPVHGHRSRRPRRCSPRTDRLNFCVGHGRPGRGDADGRPRATRCRRPRPAGRSSTWATSLGSVTLAGTGQPVRPGRTVMLVTIKAAGYAVDSWYDTTAGDRRSRRLSADAALRRRRPPRSRSIDAAPARRTRVHQRGHVGRVRARRRLRRAHVAR